MGLLGAAVFTRRFSPADYGRYSLALTIVNIAVLIGTQWLQQATNRYVPGEKGPARLWRWKSAIARSLVFSAIGVALAGALAASVAGLLLEPTWRPFVIPSAALALANGLINSLLVVLQAEIRSRDFARFRLLAASGSLVVSCLLVFPFGGGASMLLWGTAVPLLLLVLPLWRSAELPLPPRHLAPEARAALRTMAAYGVPLTGWFLATTLLFFGDRFVIQFFRGEHEVGVYSATYLLVSGSVSLLATPMIMATHPLLVRLWESEDREAAGRWLQVIVELFLITGGLLVAGTGLFAGDVARLMLGPSFREGSAIMPLLATGALVWQLAMYVHKPLEFAGRTMQMLWFSASAFAVDIVLNLAAVPVFGYRAAASALLAGVVVYLGLAHWNGRRILRWGARARFVAAGIILAVGGLLFVRARSWLDHREGPLAGFAISASVFLLLLLACYALARPALDAVLALRHENA
jgi:O-antigen/teichoic acid export membrane protein